MINKFLRSNQRAWLMRLVILQTMYRDFHIKGLDGEDEFFSVSKIEETEYLVTKCFKAFKINWLQVLLTYRVQNQAS